MTPILTTITPYWSRPEMLRSWMKAIQASTIPEVHHLIYFVGEKPSDWWAPPPNVTTAICGEKPGLSIGYYHNMGAKGTTSEWIMKLDVDLIPNVNYFPALLKVLETAGPREWFNGGMFYLNRQNAHWTGLEQVKTYEYVMANRQTYSANPYLLPAATNFICRRQTYLDLGGCDPRFRGWGWEDYQQIYLLERHQRQQDPLPGTVTLDSVSRRCRDEISRPKAKELWERNPFLCLIHRWHPEGRDLIYRNPELSRRNKEILLECIVNTTFLPHL